MSTFNLLVSQLPVASFLDVDSEIQIIILYKKPAFCVLQSIQIYLLDFEKVCFPVMSPYKIFVNLSFGCWSFAEKRTVAFVSSRNADQRMLRMFQVLVR